MCRPTCYSTEMGLVCYGVPYNFLSGSTTEQKFHGMKVPQLELSFPGAKVLRSEKAMYHPLPWSE